MRTYTPRIVDPADDPDALAEALGELERRCGCVVSCETLDGRLRLQRRDQLLREAHGLMSGGTTKKCEELAAAIARFEGTTWPRWRDHGTPPGGSMGISVVQSCLFKARQLGTLPSSARQIFNIVMKRSGPGNFIENPVSSDPDPE